MAENCTLSSVQMEIYKAIKQMDEKSSFTEFQIVKKIRENLKFEGKKKAGICLQDLLTVAECLNKEGIFYSIHVNSVNECLIKKETEVCQIALDAKQRRQKSEKSMSILTSSDISEKNLQKNGSVNKDKGKEKRHERKKISIYDNFEE